MNKIVLPLPPSVNALFGGGSKQKRFPSQAYKAWWLVVPKTEPLWLSGITLTYTFYFPNNIGRDCANYEKAVTDWLVKCGTIVDDCWQHLPRLVLQAGGIDKANPRVEIEIHAQA